MAFARVCRVALFLLWCWSYCQAQEVPPLNTAWFRLLEQEPEAARGFWGVHAVELSTGRVLASVNSAGWFVPASLTKLFSAGLGMRALGLDYRFETLVCATAPPDAQGVIHGDLILLGGGDPSLGSDRAPYKKSTVRIPTLDAVGDLAAQLVNAGVKRIRGCILGDDTRYLWEPRASGWSRGDDAEGFAAPVSALTLNENQIRVVLRPGVREGDSALVTVQPEGECQTVLVNVLTRRAGGQRIAARYIPSTGVIEITGGIPLNGGAVVLMLGVDDPARYAACLLRAALERAGIVVDGPPRARHRWPGNSAPTTGDEPRAVLARRVSPPLAEILPAILKDSWNLGAEILFLEAALAGTGAGDRRSAASALDALLRQAEIPAQDVWLEDGSGLSRLNLVTPRATVQWLAWLWRSPQRESWLNSLAVGGEDGTLQHRFEGLAKGRVRAKSGTLSGTAALAGYVESRTYGTVAFAIYGNQLRLPPGAIRQVIDRFVREMLP